jgi:hypothetical protein
LKIFILRPKFFFRNLAPGKKIRNAKTYFFHFEPKIFSYSGSDKHCPLTKLGVMTLPKYVELKRPKIVSSLDDSSFGTILPLQGRQLQRFSSLNIALKKALKGSASRKSNRPFYFVYKIVLYHDQSLIVGWLSGIRNSSDSLTNSSFFSRTHPIDMKSFSVCTVVVFALLSLHTTKARLIGKRWFKQDISIANPTVSLLTPTNGDRQIRIDALSITATIQATIFDNNNIDNGDSDACYDCCCDRDVVCMINSKSEATCEDNGCGDGATCASREYTCPSYDCDHASEMW